MSQLSPIQAFDFGLGQLLATIYSAESSGGPRGWEELLKRPPARKIFRGNIDDRGPNGIVKAVESMKQQLGVADLGDQKIKANAPSLPLVAYGRRSGLTVVEPEAAGYQFGKHAIVKKDGDTQQVNLDFVMVEIRYQLLLMAWDQPTLDAMQLAWMTHVPNAKKRHHKFDLAYEIDGCLLQGVTAEIIDPKTVEFEDASIQASEGRLHAVSLPLRVRGYAIRGAQVSLPTEMRWQLELRVADGGCHPCSTR